MADTSKGRSFRLSSLPPPASTNRLLRSASTAPNNNPAIIMGPPKPAEKKNSDRIRERPPTKATKAAKRSTQKGRGQQKQSTRGKRVKIPDAWLQQPKEVEKAIHQIMKSGNLVSPVTVKRYGKDFGKRMATATRSVIIHGELVKEAARQAGICYSAMKSAVTNVRLRLSELLGGDEEESNSEEEETSEADDGEDEEGQEDDDAVEQMSTSTSSNVANSSNTNQRNGISQQSATSSTHASVAILEGGRRLGITPQPPPRSITTPTPSSSSHRSATPAAVLITNPPASIDPLEAKSARTLKWLNTHHQTTGEMRKKTNNTQQCVGNMGGGYTPLATQVRAHLFGNMSGGGGNNGGGPPTVITVDDDDDEKEDDDEVDESDLDGNDYDGGGVLEESDLSDEEIQVVASKKRKLNGAVQSTAAANGFFIHSSNGAADPSSSKSSGYPLQLPPPKKFPTTPISVSQLEHELVAVLKPRYIAPDGGASAETLAKMLASIIHMDQKLWAELEARNITMKALSYAYLFCGHYLDLLNLRLKVENEASNSIATTSSSTTTTTSSSATGNGIVDNKKNDGGCGC